MRGDVHLLVQVETVGDMAMDAAVEVEFIAVQAAGLGDQPVEEAAGEALPAGGFGGNQIINVERLSPGEHLGDAVACGRYDVILALDVDEAVAGRVGLAADLGEEAVEVQVRAELVHDREAAGEVGGRFGDADVVHGGMVTVGRADAEHGGWD